MELVSTEQARKGIVPVSWDTRELFFLTRAVPAATMPTPPLALDGGTGTGNRTNHRHAPRHNNTSVDHHQTPGNSDAVHHGHDVPGKEGSHFPLARCTPGGHRIRGPTPPGYSISCLGYNSKPISSA